MDLHIILSYAKSHIYDLHGLLAATISVIIMMFLKRPIKTKIDGYVDRKSAADETYARHRAYHRKALNFVLILLTAAVTYIVYFLIEAVSPMIPHHSLLSGITSITFSLTEYAIIDQLRGRRESCRN